MIVSPNAVNLYSTVGGTVAKTSRLTNPSASNSRNCVVNMVGDIPLISLSNTLNRFGLSFINAQRIRNLYLPPTKLTVYSTGQTIFFLFSIFISFVFNITIVFFTNTVSSYYL